MSSTRIKLPRLQVLEPIGRLWDRTPLWGKVLVLAATLAFA